ncbi:MAG: DUF4065 domain-containing protein [Bacteroidales bacterium]|nr:DUF4065 domain-containing protein [Clostridium sp.]MCM1204002.1 DUF4065 domain-containing protein [Bacteroidales bacterium]
MIDIMDAARYLVYLSYHVKRGSLTPLKLQKLLYFSQGWSYVWDGTPLFLDEFEAWQYGPVNVKVYNWFKQYGRQEIPEFEGKVCIFYNMDDKETLDAIWNNYYAYSAFELVELTHAQEPWQIAYENNETIKNQDIKSFFQSTY